MDSIIQICLYTSIISGGILALLMLLSLAGGLDLDIDIDSGGSDVDSGGLGYVKSILTFVTFSAWVAYIMLSAAMNPIVTIIASLATGTLTVLILAWFLKVLLGLQSNVNWESYEAEGKNGKVYLKIPEKGTGLIQVDINGVTRELKARSKEDAEIPTGSEILILDIIEEVAEVIIYREK